MKPYIVLLKYRPKIWKKWRIHRDLTRFTAEIGLVPLPGRAWKLVGQRGSHAEVRRRAVEGSQATGWHQDGDMDDVEMNHGIVTWANVAPTQFKTANGIIYQPEPFEVVIARNLGCYHRRPPDAPNVRWLFRQRVLIPKHMGLP